MKDQDGVRERTRRFISRLVAVDDFEDDYDIFEGGVVNSLFAMQLVLFVESEFGVSVDNQDLDLSNFRSIGAIANFVDRKRADQQGGK